MNKRTILNSIRATLTTSCAIEWFVQLRINDGYELHKSIADFLILKRDNDNLYCSLLEVQCVMCTQRKNTVGLFSFDKLTHIKKLYDFIQQSKKYNEMRSYLLLVFCQPTSIPQHSEQELYLIPVDEFYHYAGSVDRGSINLQMAREDFKHRCVKDIDEMLNKI